MFVKDFMTKDPIVVSLDASIPYTADLMKKHWLKRFPVMDKGKLVGLITEKDVAKSLPSPATSLSRHEINYLTAKMTVSDAMTTDVVTTSPDTTVEEAIMLMRQHDIGCLPVLENDELVGIITESSVFDALTKLFGFNRPGLRITVQVTDRIGVIADLTTIIKNLDLTVISLVTFPTSEATASIIFRIATDKAKPVINELEAHGYQILHWTVLN